MLNRFTCTICHAYSTYPLDYVFISQVVVIEKGQVVEQGTHDQLIAKAGVYKQLVLRQLTAAEQ